MNEILKSLCLINGVSGNENKVTQYIISQIKDFVKYEIDNLGNLIVFKKGKKTPLKKLMIGAHMDEVGFIITDITEDGYLKFSDIGGIDSKVILQRRVIIGNNEILGVIGANPIHLLKNDEKDKAVNSDNLLIDIGAKTKDEAEKLISKGDYASFERNFEYFGNDLIRATAIDDRFGCSLMIEMIKSELEYDCFFAFFVQEEIGLRGSITATYSINPDIAIVLESTTACDIPGFDDEKKVCILGDGPVVTIMDKRTIYDKKLVQLAFLVADENNIKCQTKTQIAGGNDSGSVHLSRSGVRTVSISLPTRYIHSANCVCKNSDIEQSRLLLENFSKRILNDEN